MKYIKKTSVGAYLKKGEDIKDGDIVEIANEGKQVEGQFGRQDVFLIKTKNKEGNISFNQTSVNNMIDAYGEDSINWIGEKVKVWAIMSNVQGKMTKVYYFSHPEAEISDDGEFLIQNSDKLNNPNYENMNEEEIPTEDLPF